jgi:glycosyltransferase involved in cell wall biosynthesis
MNVDIITPSFNQGRFIERTLHSVASQTGAQITHFVFDGGSGDQTLEVLRNFSPAVRWVSESDRGQAHAVNKGLRAGSAEIIGWLNSDDIYYPGTIERVIDYLTTHPDVDVVYGMADHIDLDDRAFESYPAEPWDFARLQETCFICQPAAFFRRRVVESHGVLDESLNYCMDYEYWLRLGKAGVRFGYLEHKLAGSRLYADNKTLGSRVKVHREINSMFKKLFGRVPDRWLFNYAHSVVEARMSRASSPRLFAGRVAFQSLTSALRWNGTISAAMLHTALGWMRRRAG